MTGRVRRIAFLYNHEAIHQVRHTAPVAAAVSALPGMEVTILSSSMAQEQEARAIIGDAAGAINFHLLHSGPVTRVLGPLFALTGPFRRIAALYHNRRKLAEFDAIVVPETTTLVLRDVMGAKKPKLVWIPHGAGDRSIGFRSVSRRFDLVLVAGAKTYDRMLKMGAATPAICRVVGYPKFDSLDPTMAGHPLFANGRPTVVYNPHFDPRLSSWYRMGEAVLDWFAEQNRFNLVFAPHVMLFQRRLHASVEHGVVKWRRSIDKRYRQYPHILIDTGSQRSTDMSYTRAGDIYLGDVSSQIYEWIARPRPAVFLNPRELDWRGDANFAHWELGEVARDVPGMAAALERALHPSDRLLARQADAFAYTFSVGPVEASVRAANAIVDLLAGRRLADGEVALEKQTSHGQLRSND